MSEVKDTEIRRPHPRPSSAAPVEVRLIEAEHLIVGPDEVLIVRLPGDHEPWVMEGLTEALEHVGLGGRSLVIGGLDVQLAVAKKDAT